MTGVQTCALPIFIAQSELSGARLLAELQPLLADRTRLDAMGQAALTLGRPHAARAVAEAVLALAGVGNQQPVTKLG